MKTFYQMCIWLCLSLILFNLIFNFVSGMGVFDPTYAGVDIESNASGTFETITNVSSESYTGMNAVWNLMAGGAIGIGGGIILGMLFHSTVLLGISAFAGVFWASYLNTVEIMYAFVPFGFPIGFLVIITTLVLFLFVAAIIGMLSGSG